MDARLKATLKHLPDQPGVYLMKDAQGRVLYVGKAQSLRNRVRQYWQAGRSQAPLRIESAIDRVADVEVTITDTVSEALLLEANLVKRYQPRFNVRLKDDKSYPFIKVTLADDFPRIERTRKLPDDGSRYFGPYASASSVDEAMNLIRRIFPFRTCTIDITRGGAGARAAVPAVPHQALPGPLHRGHRQGRVSRRHRPGDALPRGPPGAGRAGAAAGDGVASDALAVRAGGGPARQAARDRADDGEPEDGRLRAPRPRRARLRPLRARRRPSSCSPIRDGKTPEPRRLPARERRGGIGRRGARDVRQAVLRAAGSIPPRVLVPTIPADACRAGGAARDARGTARAACRARSAARAASSWSSPRATRPRR